MTAMLALSAASSLYDELQQVHFYNHGIARASDIYVDTKLSVSYRRGGHRGPYASNSTPHDALTSHDA